MALGGPLIMIVEDEPEISRFIGMALESQGYFVEAVPGGREALKLCQAHPPDLVILDLGLPDMDGKLVIKALREWSRLPIIVLSARDQEEEKVAALDLGADDYLTKPFSTPELLARVKVALRHAVRRETPGGTVYAFLDLTVDLGRRKAALKEAELHLTPTEYDLLAVLVRKAGQVVTQRELLREVWGRDSEEHDHYLRIYIQRLRRKLGDDPLAPKYIFTEPGIGYRMAEEK
jgi:two-component system, OmpR family, KDP operon response regulator KdpE